MGYLSEEPLPVPESTEGDQYELITLRRIRDYRRPRCLQQLVCQCLRES